jgi:putative phosphoribosyl transferase
MTRPIHAPTGATTVSIPAGGVTLQGDLRLPPDPRGLIVFVHGSGSSRLSPRNRRVAEWLNAAGFGTLLFDLLIPREEADDFGTAQLRFDIPLLARRLLGATDWLALDPTLARLPLGYFGASTGAAAALVAAAARPELVRAVVSRGGRPDLAGARLRRVSAPTLLIVGGDDPGVLELNASALELLGAETKELVILPRASHLFEEPGALEEVARHAREWFGRYLEVPARGRAPVGAHPVPA